MTHQADEIRRMAELMESPCGAGWKAQQKAAAMLREYAEVVEGWRPIETAPEDGTPILIAALDDEGTVFDVLHGHFEVVAEDEDDGPWDVQDGEPWCSYVGREKGIYFCHWLPCKEWESRWMFGPNTGYTHWCRPPLTAALSGREGDGCDANKYTRHLNDLSRLDRNEGEKK